MYLSPAYQGVVENTTGSDFSTFAVNINLLNADGVIVETAYDPKYGARPLRRVIQSKIEDALAEEILAGRIKRGGRVEVGLKKKEIVFEVPKSKEVQP